MLGTVWSWDASHLGSWTDFVDLVGFVGGCYFVDLVGFVGGLMSGFAELGRHGGTRMDTSPASPRNVGVSRADWPTPAQRGWKTCLRRPMVYRRLLMTWGNATM